MHCWYNNFNSWNFYVIDDINKEVIKMINKMNKKGVLPAMFIFLIFIVILLVFMFGTGAITSFILRRTIENIPGWFWIALTGFVIYILTRRKTK